MDTVLDYTGQIAHALGYLHSHSDQQKAIFHGDLKPANVMLTGTDDSLVLKLADLDSFTLLKDKDTHRLDLATKTGTIRYMSPEMIGCEDPFIWMATVGQATDTVYEGWVASSCVCPRLIGLIVEHVMGHW
ncbi:hypothetical protein BV898_19078 [Hypsibius exemplaris]|uniref:Protein kinase domain-containing protein n=1 Tax=Hypsibius exemplaris TaxID=2072580 RepID=A0A9X6RNL0_HYPEX|nr:hypothetical protein BV898_19078 [Hypsibius exemplaris]